MLLQLLLRDLVLPSIAGYFKHLTEKYFDKLKSQPNMPVITEADYIVEPNPDPEIRGACQVLTDLNDPITLASGIHNNITRPHSRHW